MLSPETYEILFYDGFRKTVQAANVRDMTEEVQQEVGRRQVAPAVQALGCAARWRRWAAVIVLLPTATVNLFPHEPRLDNCFQNKSQLSIVTNNASSL